MPYVHVDGKYSTNLQSLQRRRKLTAECGCMITYTISINIVRFERIVSGRFSPLTAPLPRPPAPPYFFKSRSSGFRARSAYMLCFRDTSWFWTPHTQPPNPGCAAAENSARRRTSRNCQQPPPRRVTCTATLIIRVSAPVTIESLKQAISRTAVWC